MSEYPKSCSECGKCTIGSKECIGCPNFKPFEIVVQKALDLFCATAQCVLELLTKIIPPFFEVLVSVVQAALDTYCKAKDTFESAKKRVKLPRPDYKEKPKKYEAPIRSFIHKDRGRRR